MKNISLILFMVLWVQCGDILQGDDPAGFLEPGHLIGEWVKVSYVQSDVQGLLRIDTTTYQIGLDNLTDYIKFADKNVYDPLTFKILYQRGGTKYGYLERPDDNFRDFDVNMQESMLNYELNLGLPEITTLQKISFAVPRGCRADTLRVTIDSEVFGLKRKGL